MRFPDYFGMNWDAVIDCLRDLVDRQPAEGYVLFLHAAEGPWRCRLAVDGELVEVWPTAAEESAHDGVPLHLVFVHARTSRKPPAGRRIRLVRMREPKRLKQRPDRKGGTPTENIAMIELYTYATSNGQRASIMLEECGIPYKAIKIDLEKGEQKTPNYLKINPSGQIPALIDPDLAPAAKPLVVAQSGAIILYLVDKTNKLMPREPLKRAAAQQWFLQAMSDVAPASGILFVVGTIPEVTTSTRKLFEQRLINQLRNADRRLGESEFLAGELDRRRCALTPDRCVPPRTDRAAWRAPKSDPLDRDHVGASGGAARHEGAGVAERRP